MALHQNPLQAFPVVHQRGDVVVRGYGRILVPREPQQSQQKGRMAILPEERAFSDRSHRHMRNSFLRQHPRHGHDAVPVGVGLNHGHEQRMPSKERFQVMAQVFEMDGDKGAAQKHGTSTRGAVFKKDVRCNGVLLAGGRRPPRGYIVLDGVRVPLLFEEMPRGTSR